MIGGPMITETAMPDSQEMTARPASSPVGKLIVVGLFALAVGAFFYFDLKQYLSLGALKANRDSLLAYTEAHYTRSVMLFILFYCLQTAFSLPGADRKSTRLNSSHQIISYAVFCLKKK